MNNRFKRILIIIGFVVFVLGIGALTWVLFFRPLFQKPQGNVNGNANTNTTGGPLPNVNANRPANENVNQPTANGSGALPKPAEIANGGQTLTTPVTDQKATAAIMSMDGSSVTYYNSLTGKFYRVDPTTGKVTEVSQQKFPDVEKITWSPDREKAVMEFPDYRKIIYDFTQRKQYTLPEASNNFSFSSDSNKIAYAFSGNGQDNQLLVVSDLNGQNARSVQELADKASQVQIAWSPTNEVIALFREGTQSDKQQVLPLGQNQENFKAIQTEGRGFHGAWTPDGEKLLYTVYSESTNWNPELYIVNARGDRIGTGTTDLGLSTFVDKCTINRNSTTAYCAVPDALDRGSGMYPEFAQGVLDTFYSVDLTTGASRPLAQPVSRTLDRYTVTNPFLSDDERTLFFTDAGTGQVIKLRLK